VTTKEDIALVAGQLANLTRTVGEMETRLGTLLDRADNQQQRAEQQRERTEVQQDRIDLAARELAEVSARLQAAADALRASI
jgi:cell division FtsZ-interacting protein ZapD